MGKKRILIASLLKPVTDTRMFEKTGLSLAKLPDSEIHIFGVGFSDPDLPDTAENIYFHPIKPIKRVGLSRLAAQLKYLKIFIKVKPEIALPNTFELLPVTFLYKILFNVKIVYDIRENYTSNIKHQPTFPKWLRRLLSGFVRIIETSTAPFISHFLTAEKSYSTELPFLKNGFTLVENKFQPPAGYLKPGTPVLPPKPALKLLYSGTIAEVYGIFEAIQLASELYELNNQVQLTIIGYCPLKETLLKVKEMITGKPFITLVGGDLPVPHHQILVAIRKADIGLLPYRPNPSTFNCIPTKIYEYMAYALPMVVQQNPYWFPIINGADAGISIDFSRSHPVSILANLTSRTFYKYGIPETIYWKNEEEKLLKVFETFY